MIGKGRAVRVGVTGHTNLAPDTVPSVRAALREALALWGPGLVGVTCLAPGADQLFARVVLDLGGTVEVILPAADYRDREIRPADRAEFDALMEQAQRVTVMPFPESNRDAYVAASDAVLGAVERMVGVWDGEPSDARGGTAVVVAEARARGMPVDVVWPDGAHRA